jgi:hypothetical protein
MTDAKVFKRRTEGDLEVLLSMGIYSKCQKAFLWETGQRLANVTAAMSGPT